MKHFDNMESAASVRQFEIEFREVLTDHFTPGKINEFVEHNWHGELFSALDGGSMNGYQGTRDNYILEWVQDEEEKGSQKIMAFWESDSPGPFLWAATHIFTQAEWDMFKSDVEMQNFPFNYDTGTEDDSVEFDTPEEFFGNIRTTEITDEEAVLMERCGLADAGMFPLSVAEGEDDDEDDPEEDEDLLDEQDEGTCYSFAEDPVE